MIGANPLQPLPIVHIFNTAKQLYVTSDYIYFPLLYDTEIDKERGKVSHYGQSFQGNGSAESILIEIEGKIFVKGLSLKSLLDAYKNLAPESYEQQRLAILDEHSFLKNITEIPITNKLCAIIFEILPYFVSKPDRQMRKKYTREEVLELIIDQLNISELPSQQTRYSLNIEGLKEALFKLEKIKYQPGELQPGLISRNKFEAWFFESLKNKIIEDEKKRLQKIISRRQKFVDTNEKLLTVLLSVAEKGSLEIDGFGFYATSLKGEFIIYKRTGAYALKDYYGRTYLFPDCRVAINTNGSLAPFVIENYKHPFLQKHAPGQKICMRNTVLPTVFNAKNVIFALQEGINALLYGYDYRRRNGYHSLDSVPLPGGSINFDDYMIPRDHPVLKNGLVQITNEFR